MLPETPKNIQVALRGGCGPEVMWLTREVGAK